MKTAIVPRIMDWEFMHLLVIIWTKITNGNQTDYVLVHERITIKLNVFLLEFDDITANLCFCGSSDCGCALIKLKLSLDIWMTDTDLEDTGCDKIFLRLPLCSEFETADRSMRFSSLWENISIFDHWYSLSRQRSFQSRRTKVQWIWSGLFGKCRRK